MNDWDALTKENHEIYRKDEELGKKMRQYFDNNPDLSMEELIVKLHSLPPSYGRFLIMRIMEKQYPEQYQIWIHRER